MKSDQNKWMKKLTGDNSKRLSLNKPNCYSENFQLKCSEYNIFKGLIANLNVCHTGFAL